MAEMKIREKLEFFKMCRMTKEERVEGGYPETYYKMGMALGVGSGTIDKWRREAKRRGYVKEEGEEVIVKGKEEVEWEIFMKQLTADATKAGATAPTRELYAKLKNKMPRTGLDIKIGLSADERARRNLEAERQLGGGE